MDEDGGETNGRDHLKLRVPKVELEYWGRRIETLAMIVILTIALSTCLYLIDKHMTASRDMCQEFIRGHVGPAPGRTP